MGLAADPKYRARRMPEEQADDGHGRLEDSEDQGDPKP
jgi:hypothetical protein